MREPLSLTLLLTLKKCAPDVAKAALVNMTPATAKDMPTVRSRRTYRFMVSPPWLRNFECPRLSRAWPCTAWHVTLTGPAVSSLALACCCGAHDRVRVTSVPTDSWSIPHCPHFTYGVLCK